jgi:putative ABC transport system permease protein
MYEATVGDVRTSLLVLLGAVGLVLLIACANVANLLLARGKARERELAVRSALGAGRVRLIRQLLTESLVLAVIGGGLGTVLGAWSLRLLLAVTPGDIPRLNEIVLDGRVIALMVGVTLVAGMVCGLVPALQSSKSDLQVSLKEGTRGATVGAGRHRIQQALVVAEVGLSVLLVIGAGLLIKSFSRLVNVDPGFNAEKVMTAYIGLPLQEYSDWQLVTGFYDRLLPRVHALPGVQSAAVAYAHPLDPSWETSFQIEGLLELPQGQRPEARLRPVTPGYFRTAGIPLTNGRAFTERDDENAPGVVIINESFARTFFTDVDPIGRRLIKPLWWDGLPSTFEIVGVTSEVKFDGLAREPAWAMYFPHHQAPMNDMQLIVRTAGEPVDLASAIRNEVWAIDPNIPLENFRTMEDIVAESVGQPRFNMLLLGLFASLALVLAAIGIYGVISYAVAQRTNEIGIRRALGAKESRVLSMVLGQGLRLTVAGVAIGLVGAFWLSRLVSGLLFEVGATDPATFGSVAIILGAVGMVACYLPARRAMRVDPVEALRSE